MSQHNSDHIVAPQLTGHTTRQANQLKKLGKFNRQASRSARPYSRIIIENVFSLFNIVLFISIALVLYLGGSRDVLFASALLVFNISVSLIQEIRARQALDKLSMLSQSTAIVRRQGKDLEVPLQDIVSDDLVVITPGQMIVVDGPLLFASNLEVNESSLTGESHDIPKQQGQTVTSGSYCTAGVGIMQAKAIGSNSNLSRITEQAKAYRRQRTPVEQQVGNVLRYMIIAIVIFAPLTLISGINISLPLADSVENMIILLTSLVPQGLIASVAILYTYGAVRISRSHTLIQKINAVESLGAVTVLCTDKTGTLTQNNLAVQDIIPLGNIDQAAVSLHLGQAVASMTNHNSTATALTKYAPGQAQQVVKEVAFKSDRKWSGVSLQLSDNIISYSIGAPEVVLPQKSLTELQSTIQQYSQQGLRVVAFAQQTEVFSGRHPQLSPHRQPLALLVLGDQLRDDAQQTLTDFRQLGIKVKVISGDNLHTVLAIAQQAGLGNIKAVSQEQLIDIKPDQFDQVVAKTDIFARITPDMKKKIIDSLSRSGHHVGMIGDGINDVPALKQADAAIAMNSGAQVAKDVADIVLLNNAFSTLPKAIAEGRDISQRIYAIAKIFFIKAIYLMILIVLSGFASIPFPIDLRQTTLLGFVISGLPIIFITLKVIKVSAPKRPASDFVNHTIAGGLVGGLALAYLSIVTVSVFNQPIELSKTMITVFSGIFSSIMLWQIAGLRFWDILMVRRIKDLFIIILLTVVAVGLPVALVPELFHLTPLSPGQLTFLVGLALACAILVLYAKDKLDKLRTLVDQKRGQLTDPGN